MINQQKKTKRNRESDTIFGKNG